MAARQWSQEIPFGQLQRATGFGTLLLLIPEVEKMGFKLCMGVNLGC
jgi:hypothetical protein